VKGLVDGNAPYNPTVLKNNAQSYRTNVNWREAEGFLALALSAFYDLFVEAPTYAQVKVEGTNQELESQWGEALTEEFDRLQKADTGFDSLMQLSQHEMVMFGTGPVMWEDADSWKAISCKSGNLLLPEKALANVDEWELAIVRTAYPVGKIFKFIENPDSASAVGWNVEAVRLAILNAMPENLRSNQGSFSWEFLQQSIRNNDLFFSASCNVVRVAHVFCREFSGKITHCIVPELSEQEGGDFLFRKIARFEKWSEIICPFYFDKGDGFHHSIKGLGIKMYGGLEVKNRLKCSVVDGAFARTQVMLQPMSAGNEQAAALIQLGPYVQLPAQYQVIQHSLAAALDAPLAVDRDIEITLQSNLSQYRQRIDKPEGNPRTAREISATVAQSAQLGKTQMNRYYQQLDGFFGERFRRATRNSTGADADAKAFRKRCLARGIPEEAFERAKVTATRVVGQGSPMLRQQVLSELMSMIQMLPEEGRIALLRDWLASRVGHAKAEAYIPTQAPSPEMQDQKALAWLENAALKVGGTVIRTATQNDLTHADVHMTAAGQALESLSQGGNPMEVLDFVNHVGEHLARHLQGLAGDPARRSEYAQFSKQFKELSSTVEKLQESIKTQMQQGQQEQQANAPVEQNPELQAKLQAAAVDLKIKQEKADQAMQLKAAKTHQDMALKDVKTAADLHNKRAASVN
jgi:hypothetical protein